MFLSLKTQTRASAMWKGHSQSSTTIATAFYLPSIQRLLSETPPIENKVLEFLHPRVQVASTCSDKTIVWLSGAGSDIRDMDLEDKPADSSDSLSWMDCSESSGSLTMEEEVRAEDDRQLIAAAPNKARRLALSEQELLDFPTPSFEKDSLILGLLPDSVLDVWDELLISPKSRLGLGLFRAAPRRPSKRPKFILVVDLPEGEELASRIVLKRRVNEEPGQIDGLLKVPPRQRTKTEKEKKKKRKKREAMKAGMQVERHRLPAVGL